MFVLVRVCVCVCVCVCFLRQFNTCWNTTTCASVFAADLLSLVSLLHCVCQIIPSAASLNPSSLVCGFFGWHMCFPLHMYHIDPSLFSLLVLVCECVADLCVRPSKRQTGPPKVEWWNEHQIRASSGLIGLLFSQGTQTELLSSSAPPLSLSHLSVFPSPPPFPSASFFLSLSLSLPLCLSLCLSLSLCLRPCHFLCSLRCFLPSPLPSPPPL